MPFDPPTSPLRYDPSIEVLEPDEAETTRQLVETLHKISVKTFQDGGQALRSVHAKGHGILQGELEVLAGLPPVLAQGMFAEPRRYPAVLRLSTTPGDILDDSVSTPRGLGLKIIGVEGERLPGSEGDTTQDFLLVNGPTFTAPDAKHFLSSLKLLAATTDTAEGLKKALSALFRGVETIVEAFGSKSPTLTALGGQRETHILGESFFTQVPIRYGDYIAKVTLVPVSPALTALANAPLNVNGVPDGLRDAVKEFFREQGGEWELRVQLCTNLEDMPVEKASAVWPEDKSPYIAVARLTVPPQPSWNLARVTQGDRGLAFSPWHGLAAHRPLGSIMRVRKQAYEMSAAFRAEHDGTVLTEPGGVCPFEAADESGVAAKTNAGTNNVTRPDNLHALRMMTAVQIDSFGGPDVLQVRQLPVPEPGAREILLKVRAAGINPVDHKIRSGKYPAVRKDKLPYILGRDVSGVVEAVGAEVADFLEGEELFGVPGIDRGGYAEYVVLKEHEAARKPSSLDHVPAAAVPLAALTAWQGLFRYGQLEAGQKILIHAGSGGVGHFAIQFAKAKGAVVTTTVSTENLAFARELGADEVIDYKRQRFEDVVHDVDMVFDLIDGETRERSWGVLKKGGILVSTLSPPSDETAAAHGVRATRYTVEENGEELAEIAQLIDAGMVKPTVFKTFPLSKAAEAQKLVEQGHTRGKVVLTVI